MKNTIESMKETIVSRIAGITAIVCMCAAFIAANPAAVHAENTKDTEYPTTVTSEVVTDNDKYYSVRVDTTISMADTADIVTIYTIDKESGKVVTLKDLFKDQPGYLDKITKNIKQQMAEQMKEDSTKIYFYDDGLDGFEKLTGDEDFYFNKKGQLTIVFDEGEVAPMSMGVVEFTIPEL